MENYYNIHNIVKIKITTKKPEIIKEYEYYFRDFKVLEKIEKVDIEIRDLNDFSLPSEFFNISDSLFGFKRGVYDKNNNYAIIFENEKMLIFIGSTSLSANFFIEYYLLKNNCTFIHGAGISYKDKGIIFPAPPNTGKTLLISGLRKKDNIKFFGDDYIIIKKDGTMYSYPMDFSIYNYHFNFFEELSASTDKIKIKRAVYERLIVKLVKDLPIKQTLKKVARFVGYDFLQGGEYLKIPASRLIPKSKIGATAKLKYSIFLNKYNGSSFRVEKMELNHLCWGIQGIMQTEWIKTKPVFFLLSSFFLLDLSKYLHDIKETVYKSFEGVELYRAFIPDKMKSEDYIKEMEKFLEKNIFSRIQ